MRVSSLLTIAETTDITYRGDALRERGGWAGNPAALDGGPSSFPSTTKEGSTPRERGESGDGIGEEGEGRNWISPEDSTPQPVRTCEERTSGLLRGRPGSATAVPKTNNALEKWNASTNQPEVGCGPYGNGNCTYPSGASAGGVLDPFFAVNPNRCGSGREREVTNGNRLERGCESAETSIERVRGKAEAKEERGRNPSWDGSSLELFDLSANELIETVVRVSSEWLLGEYKSPS